MARPKESARLREERIAGTDNGLTLRTRVVRDRKKYTRKIKHRKSIAEAMDFALLRKFAIFGAWLRNRKRKSLSTPAVSTLSTRGTWK